ncbi:translation elongation factor-like protein [Candidatus Saganbacteria bacterium]|nr:translation elongation factor-like protein [Candidatus Saganbacteria bacterium]
MKIKRPKEKQLGKVDHFFGHLSVAAIKLTAPLKVGDIVHIKGHTTDFTQPVDSIQIEHESLAQATKGEDIGIKVKDKVREHDVVYLAAQEKMGG